MKNWAADSQKKKKEREKSKYTSPWHPPECNDVVLISVMEAFCIRRVMIMKLRSKLSGEQSSRKTH